MTRPELTGAARDYRLAMWFMLVLALACLAVAVAGLKGWIPGRFGLVAIPAFVCSLGFGGWLGLRAHRRAEADQDMRSQREMIVLLAAQLGKQDDEALERIAARGGPAGEAASLILQGRRQKGTGGADRARA